MEVFVEEPYVSDALDWLCRGRRGDRVFDMCERPTFLIYLYSSEPDVTLLYEANKGDLVPLAEPKDVAI
jgi:hypothetical protein